MLEKQEDKALQPIVRRGLSRVEGMGLEATIGIAEAREIALFENPDDLANRASLNNDEIRALASANALRALSGYRHRTVASNTSSNGWLIISICWQSRSGKQRFSLGLNQA